MGRAVGATLVVARNPEYTPGGHKGRPYGLIFRLMIERGNAFGT